MNRRLVNLIRPPFVKGKLIREIGFHLQHYRRGVFVYRGNYQDVLATAGYLYKIGTVDGVLRVPPECQSMAATCLYHDLPNLKFHKFFPRSKNLVLLQSEHLLPELLSDTKFGNYMPIMVIPDLERFKKILTIRGTGPLTYDKEYFDSF